VFYPISPRATSCPWKMYVKPQKGYDNSCSTDFVRLVVQVFRIESIQYTLPEVLDSRMRLLFPLNYSADNGLVRKGAKFG